jgi:hypothetical protein
MREAAGGLQPYGPAREELDSQARTPAGPANAVRLALRRQTHGGPDTGALSSGAGHLPPNARALTICPKRPAPPSTGSQREGTRKLSAGTHEGRG